LIDTNNKNQKLKANIKFDAEMTVEGNNNSYDENLG
jgi:hypothetical protein